jgi:hypothetical protein
VPVGGCLSLPLLLIELRRAAIPTAFQPQVRAPLCASAASHLTLPSSASETSLGKLIRTLERDKAQVKRQEPRACSSRDMSCFAAWHFGLRRQPDLAGASLFAIGQEAPASGRMRAVAAARLLFAAPHRMTMTIYYSRQHTSRQTHSKHSCARPFNLPTRQPSQRLRACDSSVLELPFHRY